MLFVKSIYKISSAKIGAFVVLMLTLFMVNTASAQQYPLEQGRGGLEFSFRMNSAQLDPNYNGNAEAIRKMDILLSDYQIQRSLDSVVIISSASLDGPSALNDSLAEERTKSIYRYIVESSYIEDNLPDDYFVLRSVAEDWDSFRASVVADKNVPFAADIISIIDSDDTPDRKKWLIKSLHGRRSWEYLAKEVFPKHRYSNSILFYRKANLPRHIDDYVRLKIDSVLGITTKPTNMIVRDKIESRDVSVGFDSDGIVGGIDTKQPTWLKEVYEPIFAVKTNLLFDALSLANIEIEVPIGQRWSVAGEWIGAWWIWDNDKINSKRHRIQTKTASLEGRYWLGDMHWERAPMTGWFVGGYGTYGSFDFEYNSEGVQSKDLWSVGITAGYAHKINRSGTLRMEYSLGVGVANFSYKKYTSEYNGVEWTWRAYRDYTTQYTWVGPTKAKVSLVWMISKKSLR